jgi:hypothetical protein
MTPEIIPCDSEPRGKTYAKVAPLFLPAFGVWVFITLWLLPALAELWQAANSSYPVALSVMNTSKFVQHNFLVLLAGALIVLGICECRVGLWQQHRAKLVWGAAISFNVGVLVMAAGLLWTAIDSVAIVLRWSR